MVEGNESPVGHDTGDTLLALVVLTDDKILNRGGVHHNDIGEGEHLREDSGGEERGVLDDNEGTLILERNTEFGEEAVGGLSDDLDGNGKVSHNRTNCPIG